MIHRGEILKNEVQESGVKIAHLAKGIKVDIKTIYNWFDTPNLPIDKVLKVTDYLKIDLRDRIPELRKYLLKEESKDLDYKGKYYVMLEEYNSMLKKHNETLDRLEKMNEQLIGLLAEKLENVKRAK